MATNEGAKALFLEPTLGTLQAGALADVILIDLEQPHFYPRRHNLISHLVYSAGSRDVTHVIIDGNLVMEDRKMLTMDEKRIYAEIERCCDRLFEGK
jgi:5-methylthioadenosine/S-adenosylhomocysteine deaminase